MSVWLFILECYIHWCIFMCVHHTWYHNTILTHVRSRRQMSIAFGLGIIHYQQSVISTACDKTLNKNRAHQEKFFAEKQTNINKLEINSYVHMYNFISFSDVDLYGVTMGAFCPYFIVYCYLECKFQYLKNLMLLLIRDKIIIWASSLLGKKRQVFAFISIFFTNRS